VAGHLQPLLGGVPLARLRPEQVQQAEARLRERGLAPATVRLAHGVLRRALEDAVRWGLVARNACAAVQPPAAARPERGSLGAAELARLLEAAAGERSAALWVLAATTGARSGELLGLRWEDVDLEGGAIAIRRTLVGVGADGSPRLQEPKTARGRRVVPLGPRALAALRSHRARQLEARLQAALRLGEAELRLAWLAQGAERGGGRPAAAARAALARIRATPPPA
jgi:integrase